MGENTNLTYYQKNRNVLLNRAKNCYENNKERLRAQETYLKRKKTKKRKNGKTDATICLKRRKKTKRISKQIIVRLKGLNI